MVSSIWVFYEAPVIAYSFLIKNAVLTINQSPYSPDTEDIQRASYRVSFLIKNVLIINHSPDTDIQKSSTAILKKMPINMLKKLFDMLIR